MRPPAKKTLRLLAALAVAAALAGVPAGARATECEDYVVAVGAPQPYEMAARESARRAWVDIVFDAYGFAYIDVVASHGRGTYCWPLPRRSGGGWQCRMTAAPCEQRRGR